MKFIHTETLPASRCSYEEIGSQDEKGATQKAHIKSTEGLSSERRDFKRLCCFTCRTCKTSHTEEQRTTRQLQKHFRTLAETESTSQYLRHLAIACWKSTCHERDIRLVELLVEQLKKYDSAVSERDKFQLFQRTTDMPQHIRFLYHLMKTVYAIHNRHPMTADKETALKAIDEIYINIVKVMFYGCYSSKEGDIDNSIKMFCDCITMKPEQITEGNLTTNLEGIHRVQFSEQQWTYERTYLVKKMKKYCENSRFKQFPPFMQRLVNGKDPLRVLDIDRGLLTTNEIEQVQYKVHPMLVNTHTIQGFTNFGNSCFVNSVLKAFFEGMPNRVFTEIEQFHYLEGSHQHAIRDALLQLRVFYEERKKGIANDQEVVDKTLVDLVKACSLHGRTVNDFRLMDIFPEQTIKQWEKALQEKTNTKRIEQQDAMDFMLAIIEALYDEKNTPRQLCSFTKAPYSILSIPYQDRNHEVIKVSPQEKNYILELQINNGQASFEMQKLVDNCFQFETIVQDNWLYCQLSDLPEEFDRSAPEFTELESKINQKQTWPTVRKLSLEAEYSHYDSVSSERIDQDSTITQAVDTDNASTQSSQQEAKPKAAPLDFICLKIAYPRSESKEPAGRRILENFSEYIEMTIRDTSDSEKPKRAIRFRAKCVICHKGPSIHEGHYTTLTRSKDTWLLHDDLITQRLHTGSDSSCSIKDFDSGAPYIFFYYPDSNCAEDSSSTTRSDTDSATAPLAQFDEIDETSDIDETLV